MSKNLAQGSVSALVWMLALCHVWSPAGAAGQGSPIGLTPDQLPAADITAIILDLHTPEYGVCGDVSINGYVGTDEGTITHMTWDWGDGTVVDSWFPAFHHYAADGVYGVQVTAYTSTGATRTESTAVDIQNAEDPACGFTLRLHPATVVLRGGHISETLRLEIRGADGDLLSPVGRKVVFTSTAPSLVQVDASGTVTGTGFGEGQVEVAVEGIARPAAARVIAGHFRVEPAILLLSPTGEPTGTLELDAANADGTPVSLAGHSIAFGGGNSVASVDAAGIVTALSPPQSFDQSPYITAQLDGFNANNAAFTRVTTSSLGLATRTHAGEHAVIVVPDQAGPYPFGQLMDDLQAVEVTDEVYRLERWLTGVTPQRGDIQYMALDPGHDADGTVPCGLSGNPLRLGQGVDNNRSCFGGDDWLHWGIMAHEMGHNFVQQQPFWDLVSGLPNESTYSEGLASILGIYAVDRLLDHPDAYGLTITTTENLSRSWIPLTPSFARTVFYDELSDYEADPDYADFNADILDGILTTLHDKYGATFLYRLLSAFLPMDKPLDLSFQNEAQRLAFWVAACSAAADDDLRPRYRDDWGFPLDDDFYDQIYLQVESLVRQRDSAAFAGEGRTVEVGQSVTLDDAYVFDWEGDPLTLTWQILSRPAGSSATLSDPAVLHTSFVPDRPGMYTLSLTATDGFITGLPSTVDIVAGSCDLFGDANCDCVVSGGDIQTWAGHWRTRSGHPGFDPAFDVDGDLDIDVADLMPVAEAWGTSCAWP